MNWMERTPRNCARYFNLVTVIFIVHFALVIAAMTILKIFIIPAFVVVVGLVFVVAMLSYQLGHHPAITVLLCLGLAIPFASLLIFATVYFQAKSYLVDHNYQIDIMGASPGQPKEAVTDEMDRLIQEGKIRIPSPNETDPANQSDPDFKR